YIYPFMGPDRVPAIDRFVFPLSNQVDFRTGKEHMDQVFGQESVESKSAERHLMQHQASDALDPKVYESLTGSRSAPYVFILKKFAEDTQTNAGGEAKARVVLNY